jgi:hypothetical protein
VGVGVSVGGAGVSVAVGAGVSVGGGGVSVAVAVAVGVSVEPGGGVGVSVEPGGGVFVAVFVGVAVGATFATDASRQPAPGSVSTGLQLDSWNPSASADFAWNSVRLEEPIAFTVKVIVATVTLPVGPVDGMLQAMKASPVAALPSAWGSLSGRSPLGGVAEQSKPLPVSAPTGAAALNVAESYSSVKLNEPRPAPDGTLRATTSTSNVPDAGMVKVLCSPA